MDIIPSAKEKRAKLRACMLCSLVKSESQFIQDGCENCDGVLGLKGNDDAIKDCTTTHFDGLIGLMQPTTSWVARWQRIDKCTKGMYAMRVGGSLPEHIKDELMDKGIKYRPRDGSANE